MSDGYIKLWRQSLSSNSWRNPKQWRVWTWCLLKATYCEVDQPVGKRMVHLLPGQFVTGRFKATEETGLSEQEIRNQLNNLQINQQITIKSTNKYSVITIVKWADYQAEPTNKITSKTSNKEPAKQPQTRSNTKKNKEVKKTPTPFKDDGLFDTFWKEYPKKIGKVVAEKAFYKHKPTPELLAKMLLAIQEQKKSDQWVKDMGQFIPHPSTWLNQKRWEDELIVSLEEPKGDRSAEAYLKALGG